MTDFEIWFTDSESGEDFSRQIKDCYFYANNYYGDRVIFYCKGMKTYEYYTDNMGCIVDKKNDRIVWRSENWY